MLRKFGIRVFVIFALIIVIVGYNAASHWV